ncbi:hypothetical protein BGZ73_002729 [Actinomortierella ambigua]|nr:hypothetical protein BGZ73_002729 [Actinomortierella ambigua]
MSEYYTELSLSDFVSDVWDSTRQCLIKYGCLPKLKHDTGLFVANDKTQFLGSMGPSSQNRTCSGSSLKDSSGTFEPLNDGSRGILEERLLYGAVDMLFSKSMGRYRPASGASYLCENIMEHSDHELWKAFIEDTGIKLVV